MPAAIRKLRELIGSDRVVDDPAITARYLRDWTGRFGVDAGVVVRPQDTQQVSEVLSFCHEAEIAVAPQSGNTGLVGGSVPRSPDQVVLSLSGLAGNPAVDRDRRQILAGAGVTIGEVQRAAATAGLRYGVDLASRDSATVGGTIATNAGGLRVLRSGDTRAQLIGLEAVLADGTVLSHLDGHTRDNTGYHLPSLLAGSEGTLAVIAAARLRLLPLPAEPASVLVIGLKGSVAAVEMAGEVASIGTVTAIELMMPAGVELVVRKADLPPLFSADYGAYLLVETLESGLPAVAERLERRTGEQWDVAVAQDPSDAARLWSYRERHTEAIATVGTAVKMDVTLPLAAAADFLEQVPGLVAQVAPGSQMWLFGHIGDGNVHVNVTGVPDRDRTSVEAAVYGDVAARGGSISAEHGIGIAKREWLPLNRSQSELALFARIKRTFDPAGILNPGVIF